MEPMMIEAGSAIAGAVAAGALDGVTEGVKSRVSALIERIRGAFKDDEDALADLRVYARRPSEDLRADVLGHLEHYGVVEDAEIVEEARSILAEAGPTASGAGSVAANVVNQTVNGGGSAFTGGQHTITNNYGQVEGGVPAPRWALSHYSGKQFMLENIGEAPAYDVYIDVADAVRFDAPEDDSPIWQPGDARVFFAAKGWGACTVTVRYALSEGGDVKTLKRPLPSED